MHALHGSFASAIDHELPLTDNLTLQLQEAHYRTEICCESVMLHAPNVAVQQQS